MSRLFAVRWEKRLPLAIVLATAGFALSCSLVTGKSAGTVATSTAPSDPTATENRPPDEEPTVDYDATRRAEENDKDSAATDAVGAVLGEVSSALDAAGETMGSGSVIFYMPEQHPVDSSKPNILSHELMDSSVQAADFAFHSNITWETKQKVGIVYCVMMFRISGDLDMDPWYMMQMGRISGLGHIFFDVVQQWSIIGQSDGNASNYIKTGNGDSNEVLLVARANQFTAYVNGRQVSVWWNTKIDQGGFGIGTMQDTGASTCTFADTWIWSFD
jgi:hypothetical protein